MPLAYTVTRLPGDPPAYVLQNHRGERIGRPLYGEEARERYEWMATFANYVRQAEDLNGRPRDGAEGSK